MANGFGRQWCGKAVGLVFISEVWSLERLLKSRHSFHMYFALNLILMFDTVLRDSNVQFSGKGTQQRYVLKHSNQT